MILNSTEHEPDEIALGTMPRSAKGRLAAPPILKGLLAIVADTIASWPHVTASKHWHLVRRSQVDGIDFYVGEGELGHIHLDGSIHLATSPRLGKTLVSEGLAHPFRYGNGWVEAQIHAIGSDAAVTLFQMNYERLLRTTIDRGIKI